MQQAHKARKHFQVKPNPSSQPLTANLLRLVIGVDSTFASGHSCTSCRFGALPLTDYFLEGTYITACHPFRSCVLQAMLIIPTYVRSQRYPTTVTTKTKRTP